MDRIALDMPPILKPRRRDCLFFIFALALCGCGRSLPDAPIRLNDTEQRAVIDAMDRWKKGESPEALAKGTPPIKVIDGDWKAGAKLIAWRLVEEPKNKGIIRRIPVELKLRDDKGKTITRVVRYSVSVNPSPSIVRETF